MITNAGFDSQRNVARATCGLRDLRDMRLQRRISNNDSKQQFLK